MLKLLIEKRSRVEGSQALHYAAKYGAMDNVKFLLGAGVDVNEDFCYDFYGEKRVLTGTALHWALKGSLRVAGEGVTRGEVVRFLLEKGARVEIVDAEGKTAVQLAVELGDIEATRVFVEYGSSS